MSRGIFQALTKLKTMIESIEPKTDSHHSFISIDDGSGLTSSINDRPFSQREFMFDMISAPMDDGMTGLSGRKRATIELNVRYSIIKEYGFKMRIMTEDSSYLIDKLKGPDYDFNTTGIVSLIPAQSRLENITDQAGEIIGLMLILPFDLLYLEN
jgi:hypothetical protein